MKQLLLTACALLICNAMMASGIQLGLSVDKPTYKTYGDQVQLGVQVGDPETFKSEFPSVFDEEPALAPQDEETLKFGILAGFVMSTLGGDFSDQHDYRGSFLLGVYMLYAISANIMLMPELFYIGLGSKWANSSSDGSTRLGYIMLPIMLMYAITANLMVGLGPYIGFLISAKDKGDDFDEDIKDFVKGVDFGLKLGVYYKVSQYLTLGLSYFHGLANVNDFEQSVESYDDFNRAFALTACLSLAALGSR